MATLTVVKFPTANGADDALDTLHRLQSQQLIRLHDAAIGAGAGALMGSLRDVGISEAFIKDVREKITPGTSALFVLTSDAVLDRVAAEFHGSTGEIIHTNLSQEEEARLHEAFDQD